MKKSNIGVTSMPSSPCHYSQEVNDTTKPQCCCQMQALAAPEGDAVNNGLSHLFLRSGVSNRFAKSSNLSCEAPAHSEETSIGLGSPLP